MKPAKLSPLALTAILVALAAAGTLVGLLQSHPAAPTVTATATGAPSYEDTVRAEQQKWGHGRTLDAPPAGR